MKNSATSMVLMSFIADALSLGVHWIYNTNVIDKKWGQIEGYIKPERPTYHPTKDRGDFTHYGDQTLVLLESVSAQSGFDLDDFSRRWLQLFDHYDGYFDGATKATLENMKTRKNPEDVGSDSDDLAGAGRIAPLVYAYQKDLEKLISAARAQTAFTHNNDPVIDAAEYFARVIHGVLNGQQPTAALRCVRDEEFNHPPYSGWIEKGLQSTAENTRAAIKDFGQMCEVHAAFPCVVHLISKYENNMKAAMVENAMAGGDSAGRGLILGAVLGAYPAAGPVPDRWLSELKAYDRIVGLLAAIDAGRDDIGSG
jgi:ADP-ribosylglycohydrolase